MYRSSTYNIKFVVSCFSSAHIVLKVKNYKLAPQIGHFEKRLRNGWRKCQVTLVVSHKARP
jgi:hypothetical protein